MFDSTSLLTVLGVGCDTGWEVLRSGAGDDINYASLHPLDGEQGEGNIQGSLQDYIQELREPLRPVLESIHLII